MSNNLCQEFPGAKSKLTIALSIWMFKPGTGGLQAHAEQLARALQQQGHEVVVVTRAYRKVPEFLDFLFYNEPPGDVEVNGVRGRPLRFSPLWKPVQWLVAKCIHRPALRRIGIWLYQWQARKPAREAFAGFNLIHYAGQATALIGFAAEDAARHHGVPFLVQPTCHPFQAGDTPLDHACFERADRLLVHTRYEAGYFSQNGYHLPVDVVGNGIEDRTDGNATRFRDQYNLSGPIILYLGRKDSDKGYPLVIEAFKLIHAQRSDVALVCIGPAGYVHIDEQIDGLVDLEFVPEQVKHDALAACTCLCVPSEGESFGLVYMEAGRYGKPVVAKRLPVLEELLENGRAGLLIGALDASNHRVHVTANELAAAVCQLLESPAQCAELGRECRRVSNQFVWAQVVTRFEQAYRTALCRAK
jgi:glycosyltransferase involved in cell wall biosynthesis